MSNIRPNRVFPIILLLLSLACQHPAIAQVSDECRSLVNQNYAFRSQGDYRAAEQVLLKAEKIAHTDREKILVFNGFGGLYMHTDERVKAQTYFRQALSIGEKLLPADSLDLAALLDNLSVVCSSGKSFAEAESYNLRAINIYRKHTESPNANVDLVTVLGNRGYILSQQRKWPEAAKSYEEAVDICRAGSHIPVELYATTLDNLGSAYFGQGLLEKAELVRIDALSLFETSQGQNHPETIKAKQNLAVVYVREGKLDEAEKLLSSALQGLKGRTELLGLQGSCARDYDIVKTMISDRDRATSTNEQSKQTANSGAPNAQSKNADLPPGQSNDNVTAAPGIQSTKNGDTPPGQSNKDTAPPGVQSTKNTNASADQSNKNTDPPDVQSTTNTDAPKGQSN